MVFEDTRVIWKLCHSIEHCWP